MLASADAKTRGIPAFYEALSEELAELTRLPPRVPPFPLSAQLNLSDPIRAPQPVMLLASANPAPALAGVAGSLAELTVTQSTNFIIEKVQALSRRLSLVPAITFAVAWYSIEFTVLAS